MASNKRGVEAKSLDPLPGWRLPDEYTSKCRVEKLYSNGCEVVEQRRSNCREPSTIILPLNINVIFKTLAEGASLFQPTG